jgi:hypothetical protein
LTDDDGGGDDDDGYALRINYEILVPCKQLNS